MIISRRRESVDTFSPKEAPEGQGVVESAQTMKRKMGSE